MMPMSVMTGDDGDFSSIFPVKHIYLSFIAHDHA